MIMDFNSSFLNITWRLEEFLTPTDYSWSAFIYPKIIIAILLNCGPGTFVTNSSQMNLFVSRCHVHCFRDTVISWGGIRDVERVQSEPSQDLISLA